MHRGIEQTGERGSSASRAAAAGCRLRRARLADVPRLPMLEQSAGELFRTAPGLAYVADGENHSVDRYRTLVADGWSWVVRDADGSLCGFLCAEQIGDTLHIWETGVRRDRQRAGIGRRMLRTAIRAARRQGIVAVTLTTFRDVAWNAPFYAALGFRELPPAGMPPHLEAILDREAQAGLPPARRCAMALPLA